MKMIEFLKNISLLEKVIKHENPKVKMLYFWKSYLNRNKINMFSPARSFFDKGDIM